MNQIEQIQLEMATIRNHLHQDVTGVVQDAGTILDWRSHIRKAPWISMAIAFALGYLLVPRRSSSMRQAEPVGPPMLPLADRVTSPPLPSRTKVSGSWMRAAVSWALPIALRVAQTYLITRLEKILADQKAPDIQARRIVSERLAPSSEPGPNRSRMAMGQPLASKGRPER